MKIVLSHHQARRRGVLMVELMAAMALLVGAVLPLAYSLAAEGRLARALYQRSVAVEIVDGEMEVLLAGEWRNYTNGQTPYKVHAGAATNLPPGRFVLTVQPGKLRLEWQPQARQHGGAVLREARLP